MSKLTRDGTAEPVSRDQILRRVRGQENINFPLSGDHEQDWQPHPVDPYSAICDDHTHMHITRQGIYIHTYNMCKTKAISFRHFNFNMAKCTDSVCCVCFLPIHCGHQVRRTYQPGSHRRKVTQDFSPTFFLRCVP